MAQLAIDLSRFAAISKASIPTDVLTRDTLLLARESSVSVHWAPFDHIARTARLVLVGITPGRVQALNALDAFCRTLRDGADLSTALRRAKFAASFSGAMRGNLVQMLNVIGAHETLGVPDCAALFDPAHELVHFTSALRYPVFVNGKNYNGSPNMLRTPLLCGMLETLLEEEALLVPGALWLPLGPKPAAALRHLISRGVLRADQLLEGMPHPSGANQERINFFTGRKLRSALSSRTRPEPIERARDALISQMKRLRSA